MDRAFEGLLISVVVHILLVVLYFNMPSPPTSPAGGQTEVTIIEKPATDTKKRMFIPDRDKQPDQPQDANEAADFLAQFTKRVKKQVQARRLGPALNLQPTPIPLQSKDSSTRNRVAGAEDSDRKNDEDGIGFKPRSGSTSLDQFAMGQSSTPAPIPGVETAGWTSVNTNRFTYGAFYNRIEREISNRWYPSIRGFVETRSQKELQFLSQTNRTTLFEVRLKPSGEYASTMIIHSSGDRNLDQLNVEAVTSALPFLNPPRGMIESDGLIHLGFNFTIMTRPPLGQAVN